MTDLIAEAAKFAYIAHANQYRKYTDLPYFTHVYDVAKRVSEIGASDEMVAAAYLHDVVEDTDTTLADIKRLFGNTVAELVQGLTDKYTSEDYPNFNRAERKRLEVLRLGGTSQETQTIKVADLIDNSESIIRYGKGFAKIYIEEKERCLNVLTLANSKLVHEAREIIYEYKTRKHQNHE